MAGLLMRRLEPLRFATVGSVDDGKSTLIGRLLHDSKSIFEDQLEHVEAVSKKRGNDYVDLALLTDGLRAEREQGITIDVAYRYFSTPTPQLHHRRLPRPHPVHAQHGDRRLDGGPRDRADRRPPRRGRTDPPPQPAGVAARRAAPRDRGEQDGPGRLQPGPLRRDPRAVHRVRPETRTARRDLHPDLGVRRRQRGRPVAAHGLVRGFDVPQPPRIGLRGERRQPDRRALPGAVRRAASHHRAPGLPRLRRRCPPPARSSPATRSSCCRPDCPRRSRGSTRTTRWSPVLDTHRRRPARRRRDHPVDRRHRRVARRHDLPPEQPARGRPRTSRR